MIVSHLKKTLLYVSLFISAASSAGNLNVSRPLLVAGGRDFSMYLSALGQQTKNSLNLQYTIVYTDARRTILLSPTININGISPTANISEKFKQNHTEPAATPRTSLSGEIIEILPLEEADLFGVVIADTLFENLSKSASEARNVAQLVVWQCVAIDPIFDYQAWNTNKDYIVVENALYQEEDITQLITHPDQLLTEETVTAHHTPPSHQMLVANAISRATITSNALSIKHKILLVYADDLSLISQHDLELLAALRWTVIFLGAGNNDTFVTTGRLANLRLNALYLNCLGKTQEILRDSIVSFYLSSLPAIIPQALDTREQSPTDTLASPIVST